MPVAFHLAFELPPAPTLAADEEVLTPHELRIIKAQVRKNSEVIEGYVRRLDLFVNQEKYPGDEKFLKKIRGRMFLLMEENDTFRRLLCRHYQLETGRPRAVVLR